MKYHNQDCSVCRLMRSAAFSALGMGLGAGVAYLFGASRLEMVYTGITVAAILLFGLFERKKS